MYLPLVLVPAFQKKAVVSPCFSILSAKLLGGRVQECYRNAAGILQEYCRNAKGLLQEYCRNTAGILKKILQICCRNATGML